MDPRFCALVAFITLEIEQGTSANAEFLLELNDADGRVPRQMFKDDVQAQDSDISVVTVGHTWNPTPFVLPGGPGGSRFNAVALNVDGDIYRVNALIYLFNISVREKTPMGPLLWARGAT